MIDDIRARAEAVGFEVITDGIEDCPREINITTPHWTLSFDSQETFGDADGGGYRAALDLIEAEERRQGCPECYGVGEIWYYGVDIKCPNCKGTGKKASGDEVSDE